MLRTPANFGDNARFVLDVSYIYEIVLQHVAACCSILQCVAVCCSVLRTRDNFCDDSRSALDVSHKYYVVVLQ